MDVSSDRYLPESVTPEMEIRHLPFQYSIQLSHILDRNEGWKLLMKEIPRDLNEIRKETESCKISRKYSFDHIQQIDDVSKRLHRSPSQILFEEWGTSGRKRATVRDLLELLKKVPLFRAADFVATDILTTDPPERPTEGPSARIYVTLPDIGFGADAIEDILKYAPYPNSSQFAAISDSIINHNSYESINLDENSDAGSHSDLIEFSTRTVSNSNNETVSDFSQQTILKQQQTVFSSDPLSSGVVPPVLKTVDESEQCIRSALVPDFAQLQSL